MGSRARGFTLMELLIVIGVISILAAMGYPALLKSVERAYWRAAQDILRTIYAGERTYLFASTDNTYYDVVEDTDGTTALNEEWRKIYMDNPNLGAIPVTYEACANKVPCCGSTSCFKATATRSGKVMTINQADNTVDIPTDTTGWSMP